MSNPLLARHPRGALLAAALCAAFALTACGGSDNDGAAQPPTGETPAPTPQPGASDSFFAYVMARVGALLDNDEPADIDAVIETKPESTEPEPVGS